MAAVEGVPDERVTAGRHVHAHLVCTAGVDVHTDEGRSIQGFLNVIDRTCRPAVSAHTHALAMARVAADGSVQHAVWRLGQTVDHSQVLFLDRAA